MRHFVSHDTLYRAIAALGITTVLSIGPALSNTNVVGAATLHQPGDATVTSTIDPSASATAVGTPIGQSTDTPTATPTASGPGRYASAMPAASVHRTNGYQIGAYFFSGWSRDQNNNLTPLLVNGPLRKFEPLIGWYDDTQSQIDKHIIQASSVGINFFAFDWYDLAHARYATDKTLNEALGYYTTSRQRYRMNFAINFIDQAPFLPRAGEWPRLVNTWIQYFKQPDYVRVNGMPLLVVFSPENMRTMFGSSKSVASALNYLRSRVKAAHLPGVQIAVGATLVPRYNRLRIGELRSEGYDILTGYNYHGTGGEKYRTPAPYDKLVQENTQMWDRVARAFPNPYIPVITSGWDQRFSAREQKTAIIYAGRTPQKFACYASAARQWIDSNPQRTVKERMVVVFAWNEIGEGGWIIPDKSNRTAYTDSLRQAFAAKNASVCH